MLDLFLFVIFWDILMSLERRLFKLTQIATYGEFLENPTLSPPSIKVFSIYFTSDFKIDRRDK